MTKIAIYKNFGKQLYCQKYFDVIKLFDDVQLYAACNAPTLGETAEVH